MGTCPTLPLRHASPCQTNAWGCFKGLCLKHPPPPTPLPEGTSITPIPPHPSAFPTASDCPPNRFYSAPQPLCNCSELAPRAPSPSRKSNSVRFWGFGVTRLTRSHPLWPLRRPGPTTSGTAVLCGTCVEQRWPLIPRVVACALSRARRTGARWSALTALTPTRAQTRTRAPPHPPTHAHVCTHAHADANADTGTGVRYHWRGLSCGGCDVLHHIHIFHKGRVP